MNRPHTTAALLLTLAVNLFFHSGQCGAEDWKDRLRDDIAYLASEELAGRSSTEPSIHVAAKHLAKRFADSGLKTDLFDGQPFQTLKIPAGVRMGAKEKNFLRLELAENDEMSAELAAQYRPLATGIPEATVDAEMVFVGYGIKAPKFHFDEYAGVDCDGKVVVILRKTPSGGSPAADPKGPFGSDAANTYAFFRTKIRTAIKAGAAAIVLVNDPASTAVNAAAVRAKITGERERAKRLTAAMRSLPAEAVNIRRESANRLVQVESAIVGLMAELKYANQGLMGLTEAGLKADKGTTIPVLTITRQLLSRLLEKNGGQSLAELEAQVRSTRVAVSRRLDGIRFKASVELQRSNTATDNVLATIPGRGPLADETVVIGAHYDHVGMGKFGSLAPGTIAVHNGADDNASGTATMLATAGLMVEQLRDVANHRRLLFIGFTGEERGLLGSKYYVQNPRFSLDKTVAMINLDMVGRLRDNELTVYGMGTASCMEAVVETANKTAQFDLFKVDSGFGPSDHQSFSEAKIPVLFYFTGLHNDYHRPGDDANKLNYDAMEKIVGIVTSSATDFATMADRPQYQDTERKVKIRRQMTAYLGVSLGDRGDHMVFSAVVADSPASKAGIVEGDRLVSAGKTPIGNSDDLLAVLRGRSPGDQLTIKLIRGDQVLEKKVRLGSRR